MPCLLARAPWVDGIYLSATGALDGATLLGTEAHALDLLPGECREIDPFRCGNGRELLDQVDRGGREAAVRVGIRL